MRTPHAAFLLACALLAGCGGAATDAADDADLSAPLRLGFNWGNASKLYFNHWDQRSVKASDPSRPFRVARRNGVHLMRVFVGLGDVIAGWQTDPDGTIKDLRKMLDDAQRNGVRLVLSARLDQNAIEACAGHTYDSWNAAQQDMVIPGSAPWQGYLAFLRGVIGALGKHPSAYSWEATNEPDWMLGTGDGTVSFDDLAMWLNVFQSEMHDAGAQHVNMGGATFEGMTDDQLLLATEYTDILDAHLYPDYDASGAPVGDSGQNEIDAFQAHIDRVEALTGQKRPAMIGEFGTLTPNWFHSVARAARAKGWPALAWEFDGWDQFWFNDTTHTDVLKTLASLNH